MANVLRNSRCCSERLALSSSKNASQWDSSSHGVPVRYYVSISMCGRLPSAIARPWNGTDDQVSAVRVCLQRVGDRFQLIVPCRAYRG